MTDLVCLVADKNMEAAIEGLLARPEALEMRNISATIVVHPNRDPGCFRDCGAMLAGYRASHRQGLVLLDFAWDGVPCSSAAELQVVVGERLAMAGLSAWADVVVIDPELEAWVFSDSPEVDRCLSWEESEPNLRSWLVSEGLWSPGRAKPSDPKTAMERALWRMRKPRSSAIYRELARSVSVRRCADQSFSRFKSVMRDWFPVSPTLSPTDEG